MSEPNLCSLCVTIGNGYKRLYNESGDRNDVYEITVKYFDPTCLEMKQGKDVSGICFQCWDHINDFHNFKQSVHEAQSKLIEVISRDAEVVVGENETQDEVVVVLEDAARAVDKRFNLNDKEEFSFSSESVFINRTFSSDYMDVIEVSLDNISSDYITPPDGSIDSHQLSNMSHHSDDPSNRDEITENVKPIENTENTTPSKTSLYADTCNRQRGKSHKKRINHSEFLAEWREKLKCVVCDESCSSLTVLRKHFLQNHPNQECYVMCCERKFNHYDLIEDHIRLHIDPRSFKCEVCRKCFSNSRILCEHLAKRHSDDSIRTYNCPKCKKCFHTKDRRKYHLENHCTNMCRECCKLFRTEVRRKLHERMVHNLEDPVCRQCGKGFQDKRAFQEHLQEHATNSGLHMCTDCGKVVSTEWALRSHKRSHEIKQIRHKCSICKDIFTGAVPLREHMAIHTGIHTYTCPFCPMTFQYRSRMHYHRRNVHPTENAALKLNESIDHQQHETNDDLLNQITHEADENLESQEMDMQ